MHDFRPGDRVKLSELGEARSPRMLSKTGTIQRVTHHKSGSGGVAVLFDGMKEPCKLHWSYIEPIDHSAKDDC
jgi:hypothetical protein